MKHIYSTSILLATFFCCQLLSAQELSSLPPGINLYEAETNHAVAKKRLNFFIVSTPKKKRLDLESRFDILRGKIKSFFRRKKFVAIVAKNIQAAESKIRYRLKKFNASIGTL